MKIGAQRPLVFFLGVLPPPVHGFSKINGLMLNRISLKSEVVTFCRKKYIGKSKWSAYILNGSSILLDLFRFFYLSLVKSPSFFYLGLSGGKGQLVNFLFIVLARIKSLKIVIHHHSYAYVNAYSRLTSILMFFAGPKSMHVVLCSHMGSGLRQTYGLSDDQIVVVSNAAFSGITGDPGLIKKSFDGSPVLGFLSNITAEKGIFDFFSVVEGLQLTETSVTAMVAGPLSTDIATEFHRRLARLPSVSYVGPVYGDDKALFFEKIDILLFPTQYKNEAEPVTILEALEVGVPVIAASRGCIGSMLAGSGGVAVPSENFVVSAIEYVRRVSVDKVEYARASEAARLRWEEMHGEALRRTDDLLISLGVER
ncbi:MAG: glycosyltransferase family 4 protein [Janthinobacterium lividum]